jgi:hypothetical protein
MADDPHARALVDNATLAGAARGRVAEDAFAAARGEGHGVNLERAIAHALNDANSGETQPVNSYAVLLIGSSHVNGCAQGARGSLDQRHQKVIRPGPRLRQS